MQRGRVYPQILERWLNPDLPPTQHAPLHARFQYSYTYLGVNKVGWTPWIPVTLDLANLGYYYDWPTPTDPNLTDVIFACYTNDPITGGMNWNVTLTNVAGDMCGGFSLGPANNFHWAGGVSSNNLLIDEPFSTNPNFVYGLFPPFQFNCRVKEYY